MQPKTGRRGRLRRWALLVPSAAEHRRARCSPASSSARC